MLEYQNVCWKVDLEKVLKDEIVAEIKEQHDKHLLNILMDGRIEK